MPADDALYVARALVLRDLGADGWHDAAVVDMVEDAVAARRWWVQQWPAGAAYVGGLVAQDVQEAMLAGLGRWPSGPLHNGEFAEPPPHQLHVQPELGPDPRWVCEQQRAVVAPLGRLASG